MARIGRAIEQSPSFNFQRVKAALMAQIPYDDLNTEERAVYLDENGNDVYVGGSQRCG